MNGWGEPAEINIQRLLRVWGGIKKELGDRVCSTREWTTNGLAVDQIKQGGKREGGYGGMSRGEDLGGDVKREDHLGKTGRPEGPFKRGTNTEHCGRAALTSRKYATIGGKHGPGNSVRGTS